VQAYKDHVKRVGPLTTPYESDVSIAVRVPSENGGKDEDDDETIDEFMSKNGFEFIDACPVKSEGSNGEWHTHTLKTVFKNGQVYPVYPV
jgi:hypothetical protein